MITITEAAKEQMLNILKKNNERYVRYSLDGGGCAGLIGKWESPSDLEEGDVPFNLDEGNNQLLIDKFTIQYMKDATIDYTGDFMPAFKVSIPNTSSCGCGESFQL